MSGWRIPTGGRAIDRSRPLRFRFNGRQMTGFEGDTLASALLANGVRIVGRSFKYHRPRGVVAFGADEPNALVELGEGARRTPNLKATQLRLVEGLVARSQNCWPSVGFDVMAVNDLLSPVFPAGFYYKTFMKPAAAWPLYEKIIRNAAGMGRAPVEADPDSYETVHRRADVLVIGGGAAGLSAALAARAAGHGVMLVEEQPGLGGLGTDDAAEVAGQGYAAWRAAAVARLRADAGATLLTRTTAFGHYDGHLVAALELDAEGVALRRWMIHAERIVLATGAYERPLVFAGNDRPGVMLASAAAQYLDRHGVLPGRQAVLATNNDSAYAVAFALKAAGMEVAALADSRTQIDPALMARAEAEGLRVLPGHVPERSHGRRGVTGITLRGPGGAERIACDTILTAGGWTPIAQLFTHTGGRLRYDEALAALIPDPASWDSRAEVGMVAVGACAGIYDLAGVIASGAAAGAGEPVTQQPGGYVHAAVPASGLRKQFVDQQNDVTTSDLKLAVREGYRSVEHVKRYTTLGMGTDQGRLAGLNGVDVIAAAQGRTTAEIGNSKARPPFSPVTLGAMAGPFVGALSVPARTTQMNAWHIANGGFLANVGAWRRPQFYRRPGEGDFDAVLREARNVRRNVGLCDVTTLGKIDLQGPGVPELLDYVYVNGFASLKPGRCRYGVMLREDGMVLDDGTVTRLSEDRWFMTTTTGNAERILSHLERVRQRVMPGLDVTITPVTEHWGAMAVAGPRARDVLQALTPDFAVDNAALPFMALAEGRLAGIPVRILRVSFSGEMAYEIYTAAGDALRMWQAILEAGAPFGLMPYGTEAMMTMRIEKGLFVPGFEADGRTTPADLGLDRMVSRKKEFFGRPSLTRPAFLAPDRKQLVGVVATDPAQAIPRGAQIVVDPAAPAPVPMVGHVTSVTFSPELDRWIALALVEGGRSAHGESRVAASPLTGETVALTLCDPVFVDPEGGRLRA